MKTEVLHALRAVALLRPHSHFRLGVPAAILLGIAIAFAAPASSLAGDIPEVPPEDARMGDRDAALLLRVNQAIMKGCEYLRDNQKPDGTWASVFWGLPGPYKFSGGETTLALLVLLRCGFHRNEPNIAIVFNRLKALPLRRTCEAGMLLMALERKCHDRIIAARGYMKKLSASPADREWMEECVRFILEHRVASGRLLDADRKEAAGTRDVWGYPSKRGDHVNTMFALIGLRAASHCGIEVPDEAWILTLRHWIDVQEKEGPKIQRWEMEEEIKHGYVRYKLLDRVFDTARGWAYKAWPVEKGAGPDRNSIPTGSITSAGLLSIAVALEELAEKCPFPLKVRAESALRDGFAWLDHHWDVESNPGHPLKYWHLFYLACLGEAAVTCKQRTIGRHDWYREGAEHLIKTQKEDGSWDMPGLKDPVTDTCFALLFLARETVR